MKAIVLSGSVSLGKKTSRNLQLWQGTIEVALNSIVIKAFAR